MAHRTWRSIQISTDTRRIGAWVVSIRTWLRLVFFEEEEEEEEEEIFSLPWQYLHCQGNITLAVKIFWSKISGSTVCAAVNGFLYCCICSSP